MTSSRPYLIRAMYQWIVDNGMTPHLLVDAQHENCVVPLEHISEGKIVLNIAPMAVQSLILGDEAVTFSARFGGKAVRIHVPVRAVLAEYARENGQGMMFSEKDDSVSHSNEESDPDTDPDPDRPKPTLRVVK
jgi:stringent starvation protein B